MQNKVVWHSKLKNDKKWDTSVRQTSDDIIAHLHVHISKVNILLYTTHYIILYTDRHTNRQADRQTNRQTDKQTDRQTDCESFNISK